MQQRRITALKQGAVSETGKLYLEQRKNVQRLLASTTTGCGKEAAGNRSSKVDDRLRSPF